MRMHSDSNKIVNKLHPMVVSEVMDVIMYINLDGYSIAVTDGFRSFVEQDALYRKGRDTDGKIVTNACAGSSFHNYGLAFDFCLYKDGDKIKWTRTNNDSFLYKSEWLAVVKAFKRRGWVWGGDFNSIKDYPHIEKSFGLSVSELKHVYDNGLVDNNGYVNIRAIIS